MSKQIDDQWQLDRLRDHRLYPVQEDGKVTAYYLREPDPDDPSKPGRRMMSVLLVFTPEGIAIMGDLTPERNGSVSALGYGLGWFAGQLSKDYLCGKFLKTRWVPEFAARSLREHEPREDLSEQQISELDGLAKECEDGEVSAEVFYNRYVEIFDTCPDRIGNDFDPGQSGWLYAIQRKFAELWAAREAVPA